MTDTDTRSVSTEVLLDLLKYCPDTGVLTWLHRPEDMFKTKRAAATWNSQRSGNPALTTNSQGYRMGSILNKHYMAHRVAWAIFYGEWPTGEIDHINGVRDDNRIVNLRCVTPSENRRNQKLSKLNTTGHVGVHIAPKSGRYYAKICNKLVGFFDTKDEAISARKDAEVKHGFHKNHGRKTALKTPTPNTNTDGETNDQD